jgi:hypothetical protein
VEGASEADIGPYVATLAMSMGPLATSALLIVVFLFAVILSASRPRVRQSAFLILAIIGLGIGAAGLLAARATALTPALPRGRRRRRAVCRSRLAATFSDLRHRVGIPLSQSYADR